MSIVADLEEYHASVDRLHAQLRTQLDRILSSHIGERFGHSVEQRRFAALLNRALDRVDGTLCVGGETESYRLHVRNTSPGRCGFRLQRPDGDTLLSFSVALVEGVHVVEKPLNKRQQQALR